MPSHVVTTATQAYTCTVQNGISAKIRDFLPSGAGKVFVVTTPDVHALYPDHLAGLEVLHFPGGEPNKRLTVLESLADQMLARGADRSSVVVAFGGGICGDVGGFLAAIFMRGVPVIQVPTTVLAQVDAAVGGKTGVNLQGGKNLLGSFHQPHAVLIDPAVLRSLPAREYRAGLFEVIKHGIIASPELFAVLADRSGDVLAQHPEVLERIIDESVRIKAGVVSADEKEGGLRRILNYGHTLGHALEAETNYSVLLHGEAVAYGMLAAGHLAVITGHLAPVIAAELSRVIHLYGPLPSLSGITPEALAGHIYKDKKTIQGQTHFVLATAIGQTEIVRGIPHADVVAAAAAALA